MMLLKTTGVGCQQAASPQSDDSLLEVGYRKPDMIHQVRCPTSLLIASGDDWSARAMESILSAEGFEVRQVRSSRDAIELALSGTVDAVVTDESLPDGTSHELCRSLRADRAIGCRLPVILMLHGPVDRETRLYAHEAGFWQVFGEPLDALLIARQLAVFIASRQRSCP